MLTATCHCGAIRVEIPRRPRTLTSCNCSICSRTGALWAYYAAKDVRVIAARGATQSYAWGRRKLRFVRCRICGVVTHWQGERKRPHMGVNARNLGAAAIAAIRVRRLDGAATWKYLD
jgi:hypothetical protein